MRWQSAELKQLLGQLACIPTSQGTLVAPRELFDVRNRQLADAMGAAASMPADPFTSNEVRCCDDDVHCMHASHLCAVLWPVGSRAFNDE